MPKIPVKNVLSLLYDLQHQPEAQHRQTGGAGLEPELANLRKWQTQRLQHTYEDMLNNPKYRPACEFFLSDIYSARDFSQRDFDAEQLHAIFARYLPEPTLYLLADAIQMNRLTDELDRELIKVIVDKWGINNQITPQIYTQAYRICDNFDRRTEQIDLLVKILYEVGKYARNPLVGVASRLARRPARRAGWEEVYDFFERGYAALRHMKDVSAFVNTIKEREKRILDQIFSAHPTPFDI